MNRSCFAAMVLLASLVARPAMADGAVESPSVQAAPPSAAQGTPPQKPVAKNAGGTLPGEAAAVGSLTPRLRVARAGRLLSMNYELLDAAGQNMISTLRAPAADGSRQKPDPPRFTVSQDGREIDSGSFEYG